jgi:acyl-CoA reductase-like NAD-dependent aldehyde dehydrogenase
MSAPIKLPNFIDGKFVHPENVSYQSVVSPSDEQVIAQVPLSKADDVDQAVEIAKKAFEDWSSITIKQRAAVMLKFHHLMDTHSQELAELIVKENGKNIVEALADVAKGNETVEWACSLPQLAPGRLLEVSKGILPGIAPATWCRRRHSPVQLPSHGSHVDDPNFTNSWQLCHSQTQRESPHHNAAHC